MKPAVGGGAWEDVCPFWRDNVREVVDCEKCCQTRLSEGMFQAAYTTQGSDGKASDATKKQACCRWEHSISIKQLVKKAQTAFPKHNFTDRQLNPLAERFMKDNMGAAPLGKPHRDPSKRKFDYKVYPACATSKPRPSAF